VRYLATLKSALHDALREGLITVNPATLARVETGRRPKVHPLEPDELGRPLDHVAADELGPLYELIAASGLRRGEALALTWDAVDLENRRLTPQRQVVQLSGEHSCSICGGAHVGLAFTKPRTLSGEGRRVDFDSHTVGLLLGHQLAQDAHREAWGDGYADHGPLFAREDGTPLDPAEVTKRFGELGGALKAAGESLTRDAVADVARAHRGTPEHTENSPGTAGHTSGTPKAPEGADDQGISWSEGTPPGTRTLNPRIKSPLLCQLS
jgi:integrase